MNGQIFAFSLFLCTAAVSSQTTDLGPAPTNDGSMSTLAQILSSASSADIVMTSDVPASPSDVPPSTMPPSTMYQSSQPPVITTGGTDCFSKKADIVFLLDASTSEGIDNFKKQLGFVSTVVNSLDVGPDGVRVGLVTFSTDTHLIFNLKDYMDKTILTQALQFVPYQDGVTNTDGGLKYVREKSFTPEAGDRADAQNIVIVMTDGQSTDPTSTIREARQLRANGSIIITVGIGNVDQNELTNMASGTNYTLQISDFNILGESYSLLQPLLCDAINGVKVPELYIPCQERAVDLAILLDASGSEGLTHFREQTQFAADLVSRLVIGRSKAQVGVITFSTNVNRQFYLNQYDDTLSVVNAIKRIPYTGGSTYTQKALNFMRTTFFDPAFGHRPGVPKVLLIMTDGQSTNSVETLREAQLLRQEGYIVLSVGIGDNLDIAEITGIASDPTLAFQVKSFNELQNFLPTLEGAYCQKVDDLIPVIPTDDPNAPVCDKMADVVFLLDSSSSEGPDNFRKQVYFAGNITKQLTVGPNDAQISVLSFSSTPHNNFFLNRYDNKYDVLDAISRTYYYSGATYTDEALMFVRTQTLSTLRGRRLGAVPIVIVLTDGQSSDNLATLAEAKLLQATGAVVIAIGIGSRTDEAELSAIASDPSHKFNVNSFDFLPSIQQQILLETCEGGGPPPTTHPECGDKPADIVFLMDASSSEGSNNFEKMKSFIADFASQFEIGQGHVQISLVAFSSDVHVESYLNTTRNRLELLQKITNIRFYGGITNTDKAFEVTRTQVLIPQRGARVNAADTVILLTDGQSTNPSETERQAKMLKDQGVQVIAIGVGSNVDSDELETVASDVQHAFNVINFDALKTIELELVQTACESCTDTEKADILVIIDSSSEESKTLFDKEISFVSNLVDGFTVGPQNTQFGLMTFATTPHLEFWFNTFAKKQDIKDTLPKIQYTTGTTNTHDALKFAREYALLSFNGARNDSNKYVIVVTDGRAADLNKTISEANMLKKQGVTIMAIGIGQNADQKELEDIATDPTHVFIADNVDALKTIHRDITVKTCKSIFELKLTTPTPPN